MVTTSREATTGEGGAPRQRAGGAGGPARGGDQGGPGEVSAEEVAVFYQHLQALVRHYQRRDRGRRSCTGLSPNECYALEALTRHGELQLDGLARELGLPKPTASRLVAELVERGLLAREADPRDARRVRLTLTPDGVSAHAAAVALVQRDQAALLARFPPSTRRAFCDLLAGLAAQARSRADGSPSG
jgi:DNA-binding MarR family transcriptional regulator